MPEDPPEECRPPIDKAVRRAIEDEKVLVRAGNAVYTDKEAWSQIYNHLSGHFFESWKGKGVNPVPDDFFRLMQWAVERYSLDLFRKLRKEAAESENEARKKGAS
ncbi:MAG TPA: hypothetical protein VMJ93_15130 [Verrucomicrobiae bacterium]|nr:hypothetical protein [Verrucomicrobiae bacterium]